MERYQRRKLVFLFPEYKPNTVSFLHPTKNTPEEKRKETRRILNEHVGRDTTFGIEKIKGTYFVFPSEFRKAGISQENRERFISSLADQMEDAETIVIDSPVSFSNN